MKILCRFLIFPAIFAISYLTMIYGWGLSVQSWAWVIGGFVATMFLMVVAQSLTD